MYYDQRNHITFVLSFPLAEALINPYNKTSKMKVNIILYL